MPRRQENIVEPRQEVSGKGQHFVAIVGWGGCGTGRRRIAERIVPFDARGTYIFLCHRDDRNGGRYLHTYDVAVVFMVPMPMIL